MKNSEIYYFIDENTGKSNEMSIKGKDRASEYISYK